MDGGCNEQGDSGTIGFGAQQCYHNPRVTALTEQTEDGIMEIDSSQKMIIHLLCEDCLETTDPEEESDTIFLRGPESY